MPTKHLDSNVVLDVASGSVVPIKLFNVLVQRALEKNLTGAGSFITSHLTYHGGLGWPRKQSIA